MIQAMGKAVNGSFNLVSNNAKPILTVAVSLRYEKVQQNRMEFSAPGNLPCKKSAWARTKWKIGTIDKFL